MGGSRQANCGRRNIGFSTHLGTVLEKEREIFCKLSRLTIRKVMEHPPMTFNE